MRERKKSLEEIFNEIWPLARNNNLQIKILDQNALKFLASGKGFYGDRLTGSNFGAARAENKSKNLFFAESREK